MQFRSGVSSRWTAPIRAIGSLALGLVLLDAGSAAGSTFADHVAQTNTFPSSLTSQTFPQGGDSVDLFNRGLTYELPLGFAYPVGGAFGYRLALQYNSSIWTLANDGGAIATEIDPFFDAGAGWRLALPELRDDGTSPASAWLLRPSSGPPVRFYANAHEGDPIVPGVFYSRDGSYQRLRLDGAEVVVERGDGSHLRFESSGSTWRLAEHGDLFGNQLVFDYATPGVVGLTDSHGRAHQVVFETDPADPTRQRVARLELAAFGGATAVYQLEYSVANIERPSADTSPSTPATASASLLSAVVQPDGTRHTLTYGTGTAEMGSGLLASIELPTGGTLHYGWDVLNLPYATGAEPFADRVGVASRTVDSLTGATLGSWLFASQLDGSRVLGAPQPKELTTVVTFPDGPAHHHWFSVHVGAPESNGEVPPVDWSRDDYGLPITRTGQTANTDALSKTVHAADGTALRSTLLAFEADACTGCYDRGLRTVRAATVHHDDGDWTTVDEHLGFDGWGNFTTTLTSDSTATAPPSQLVRSLTAIPTAGQPWVLGRFSSREEIQGSEIVAERFCYDATSGLLLRHRRLAAAVPGPHDLLQVHEYDADGNRVTTRFYGGDVQTLSTADGDLCTLALPASEQYAFFRELDHGRLSRSGWLDASGQEFAETYDATIDPSTGLVASQDDGDGLVWSWSYDALGRPLEGTPPAGLGGRQVWDYQAASGGVAAVVRHSTFAADGTLLSKTAKRPDGFGFPQVSSQKTPLGWISNSLGRDAQERKILEVRSDGTHAQFLAFDAFSRVGRVLTSEGADVDRTWSYQGVRSKAETKAIGKVWNSQWERADLVERTTTETFDRRGRLIERRIEDEDGEFQVETRTLDGRGFATTTTLTDGTRTVTRTAVNPFDARGFRVLDGEGNPIFGYDALGNLTVDDQRPETILRTFDRAGRLVEEADSQGRLWTQRVYADDNSAGGYAKGKIETASRFNHDVPHLPDGLVEVRETYAYDGEGGRLSEVVTEVLAGNGGSMPLFEFATEQTTDAQGRLLSLTYPDCDIANNTAQAVCRNFPTRRLDLAWDHGRLTSLSADVGGVAEPWIDSVSYNASGFVTGRQLGNGMSETITPHPSGQERIGRLRIDHPSSGTLYDSGFAVYDGAGRLVKLGDQRRISPQAYSLALPEEPPTAGSGTTPPTPPGLVRSPLGEVAQRLTKIPDGRWSNGGEETLLEINVYGPRGLLWKRTVNDYDLFHQRQAEDRWVLRDPTGRAVRQRVAESYYATTAPATLAAAEVDRVEFSNLLPHQDHVYFGRREIGRVDSDFATPVQLFFHRDIRGALFATSTADGDVHGRTSFLY